MSAKDYQITFPFGATAAPYSPSNPHKGDDRAMPTGTPVTVNGKSIALSGNSGQSTGAHLHLQKNVNGVPTNPQGQGFDLDSPVVDGTGYDQFNGNYVRLRDKQGVLWYYLHLSEILVKQGDRIGGDVLTDDITKYLYGAFTGREPNQGELDSWRGRETSLLVVTLVQSKEAHDRFNAVKAALANTVTKQGVLDYLSNHLS